MKGCLMTLAINMLVKYLAAETALLEGKEVRLGERTLKMEDLPNIIAGRKEWEQRVASEKARQSGAPRLGGMTYSVANFSRGG